MSAQCTDTFDRIARALGEFTCHDAPAVVHLRNPLGLTNWTLPVLELTMVLGAALALWWAWRRLRRDGDPTNLVLWVAAVIYLLVTELPLYFPGLFGITDQIGVVFAHNVFSVQFLFDRLPLYIVALYPALASLAFELVRTLGVFRRHGVVVGAVCVGFVHQCFYEVFDHLGPTRHWWAWNDENPLNHPMFGTVPMTSVFIFATLGPAVLTLLTMWLVGRHVDAARALSTASLAWRTVVTGASVIFAVAVLSIPSSAFAKNVAAQAVVFTVELAVFAVVAVPVLVRARRAAAPTAPNPLVRLFGPLYLGVLAALWVTAMPHVSAGALVYAVACFLAAAAVTAAAWPRPALQNNGEVSRSADGSVRATQA